MSPFLTTPQKNNNFPNIDGNIQEKNVFENSKIGENVQKKNSVGELEIDINSLNIITAFPDDIEDVDLDNLTRNGTKEEFNSEYEDLNFEKNVSEMKATIVSSPIPVVVPQNRITPNRPVLTIPTNLAQNLSIIAQTEDNLDVDQRKVPGLSTLSRPPTKKGHLSTFFDDLKLQIDFDNL